MDESAGSRDGYAAPQPMALGVASRYIGADFAQDASGGVRAEAPDTPLQRLYRLRTEAMTNLNRINSVIAIVEADPTFIQRYEELQRVLR